MKIRFNNISLHHILFDFFRDSHSDFEGKKDSDISVAEGYDYISEWIEKNFEFKNEQKDE